VSPELKPDNGLRLSSPSLLARWIVTLRRNVRA
jgi:hypothetical protein